MSTNNAHPDTDLLPEEQALLDGKTLDSSGNIADPADDGEQTAAGELNAEALAAIAAKADGQPAGTNEGEQEAAPAAEQQPAAPAYNVADPTKFDETRQALLAKRAEAMKGLMEGTIEPDAFAQVDTEVMQGLEQLTINRTLHEANVQAEQQRMQAALSAVMADGAAKGIDYANDVGLQALFDAKLRTVAATDEMKGKSAAEVYQATHAEVLRMFGKVGAAPAPAPAASGKAAPAPAAAAPAPAPKPQIPPTLGMMPAAASVDVGNDLTSTILSMDDPDQAEAMLRGMNASQRTAALRATMPTTPLRRTGAHRNAPAEA